MKLILIRHGESEHNKKKLCQGQTDSPLTEEGIEQAKKLGKRFKDSKIDIIYSSDLSRAKDTTKEILKYHEDTEFIIDKRIRERYFGEMQGKPFPDDFSWDNLPKDVETHDEMLERIKSFFEETYTKHKNKTVLVVCHGGVKRVFLTMLQEKSKDTIREWEKPKNTAVYEFNIKEDGEHEIVVYNCVKHLE